MGMPLVEISGHSFFERCVCGGIREWPQVIPAMVKKQCFLNCRCCFKCTTLQGIRRRTGQVCIVRHAPVFMDAGRGLTGRMDWFRCRMMAPMPVYLTRGAEGLQERPRCTQQQSHANQEREKRVFSKCREHEKGAYFLRSRLIQDKPVLMLPMSLD